MGMKFNAFRERMRLEDCCRVQHETSFIEEGSSATTIYHVRLQEDRPAGLTLNELEGPDTAIVFTYLFEDKTRELNKADYFRWKNKMWFVYEDIEIVRETAYKKQRAYQCNVYFDVAGETLFGYYAASLKKYVDTTLQSSRVIVDNDKPILIMPLNDMVKVGTKLVIKNMPYKVIEVDRITNEGIAYISLDRDFISKSEDVPAEVTYSDWDAKTLKAGSEVTLDIVGGIFRCDRDVQVIKHSLTSITFRVPYGVDSLTISTKDENRVDVETVYKVVL